jgi:4-hydroxy-3-polyprenylbenzoate decarboxylase
MMLFDGIKGQNPGFRVVTNLLHTERRLALALGASSETTGIELVGKWRELARNMDRGIPPVEVSSGPVLENRDRGNDVNIMKFPAVKWHEYDGGRYFAGPVVIVRDPDGSWVNLGIYRLKILDRTTLLLSIAPGKHGRQILDRYWRRGKSCPVAVSMGHIPALFMVGTLPVPWGVSEYDIAGYINGGPIEVIRGDVTGLPIPASSEAVLEGEVPPVEAEGHEEGLWGEAMGFYASEPAEKHPVIRVKSVMYRNQPIIQGAPPMKPLNGMQHFPVSYSCAGLWTHLEKSGIEGVRGVWQHNMSMMVISLKQSYPGHAKQAAMAAAASRSTISRRIIVTVDEDVNPANLSEVVWAIGTCCDPEKDWEVVTGCLADRTDPIVWQEGRAGADLTTSKVIVNACRPVYRMPSFPRVNALNPAWKERILERWQKAIL